MSHTVKQVIVVRKDLNMRKGKMAAQVAHASIGALFPRERAVFNSADQTVSFPIDPNQISWFLELSVKIVVGVESESALLQIYEKAREACLPCVLIQDRGLTEFGGVPTYTTVGIGPADDFLINPITGHLPLM